MKIRFFESAPESINTCYSRELVVLTGVFDLDLGTVLVQRKEKGKELTRVYPSSKAGKRVDLS
jgi:hypothetical protein